jgi:phosphatidylethanolamine/phosphatidyl-N-methylethanolamine N-methyltransferase
MNKDSWLFLRLWFRSPLKIAAWAPSSPALARAFARHVDPRVEDPVLELGAGTGSITEELLATGLPPEKLIVVEKMPELCAVLRRRFPGVRVLEGDVADIGAMLEAAGVIRLSTVVSTLPIIWFPLELQRRIIDAAFARMGRAGQFLQITNQILSPLPRRKLGLRGRLVDFVWRSLPPSGAWSYRRDGKGTIDAT